MKKTILLLSSAVMTTVMSASAFAAPASVKAYKCLKGAEAGIAICTPYEECINAVFNCTEQNVFNIGNAYADCWNKFQWESGDVTDDLIGEESSGENTNSSENIVTDNSANFNSAYAKQVVSLVNAERAKNGLDALVIDESLNGAADVRAKEIVSTFSHTRPNGSSCFTVLDENGISYTGAGENIAMGQKTPSDVMTSWMNSAGHRENILKSNFTKIGVSCYKSGSTLYWVQVFAR